MNLIALLSFYDEPLEQLVACVQGCKTAGVDHLVAVDGAYALYPDGQAASHPNQHAALTLACRELGIGCTLHVPGSVWHGNEVEKRTRLFAHGLAVADEGDWFLVIDADEKVTASPADLKDQLAAATLDAGDVQIVDLVAQRAKQANWEPEFTMRRLFRAQKITVQTNHITYVADDGRVLCGWDGTGLEPAFAMTGLVIEHSPDRRPQDRLLAKLVYYGQRDDQRIERGACQRCGQPAVRLVASRWKLAAIGPVARWDEACESCAEDLERAGRRRLRQLGVDPDQVRVENRNGCIPVPAH